MDFDKTRSAGFLVNHLARLMSLELQKRLARMDLALGAYPALLELWEEEGLTQKQLVERLSIEQATMANTLSRMERDGLIRRTRDDNDGRVQRIWLTERARALEQPAKHQAMAVNALVLDDMDPAARDRFIDTLQACIARLRL